MSMGYKIGDHRDNGKEDGNYSIITGYVLGLYIEKETSSSIQC